MPFSINFKNSTFQEPQDGQADVDFFEVELVKGTQGLGITIAGYVGERSSGLYNMYIKGYCI